MLQTAVADLNDIINYLSQFYPSTALKQYDRIIYKINQLKQFPLMCEKYNIPDSSKNFRKMVVNDYLIFYVVNQETVEIYNVINAKMNLYTPQK